MGFGASRPGWHGGKAEVWGGRHRTQTRTHHELALEGLADAEGAHVGDPGGVRPEIGLAGFQQAGAGEVLPGVGTPPGLLVEPQRVIAAGAVATQRLAFGEPRLPGAKSPGAAGRSRATRFASARSASNEWHDDS